MKKNMGSVDQIVRILVAVVFGVLYYMEIVTGTLGIVLVVAAAIFAATSVLSFCPIYSIFGMNTCPTDSK